VAIGREMNDLGYGVRVENRDNLSLDRKVAPNEWNPHAVQVAQIRFGKHTVQVYEIPALPLEQMAEVGSNEASRAGNQDEIRHRFLLPL
jgi:hypothetical protein